MKNARSIHALLPVALAGAMTYGNSQVSAAEPAHSGSTSGGWGGWSHSGSTTVNGRYGNSYTVNRSASGNYYGGYHYGGYGYGGYHYGGYYGGGFAAGAVAGAAVGVATTAAATCYNPYAPGVCYRPVW